MSDGVYLTNIYRYDLKKHEWALKRDYELYQNFKFAGREFFVTKKGKYYFVCTDWKNDSLYALMHYSEHDTEENRALSPGEIASSFRKSLLSKKISEENIVNFLTNPEGKVN